MIAATADASWASRRCRVGGVMASYLENLTTRREAIATELAALNATKAGGLPDSQASGVAHRAYKDGLYAELEKLDKLIQSAQADEDGPVDLETRGEAIW